MPTHLVVFGEDEPQPLEFLKTRVASLGVESKRSERSLPGVRAFQSRARGGEDCRLYEELGLATVYLEEREARELAQDRRRIEAIVPNERRFALGRMQRLMNAEEAKSQLGRVQAAGGAGGRPRAYAGTGGGPRPYAGTGGGPRAYSGASAAEMLAYLQGAQDALTQALQRFGGGLPELKLGVASAAAEVAAASDLLWNLRLIGLAGRPTEPTGQGVKVAVLDTGLDLQHPDFQDRVPAAHQRNLIDSSRSVQDGEGHGTHCCGVVAGPSSTVAEARYGVAPEAVLLVGKVLDDDGSGYDSDILEGIVWAANAGARVISLSLGSPRRVGGDYARAYERLARRLYRRGKDCLLVAAAGNESELPGYLAPVGNPAACPSFLAVGAVDADRQMASFSCGQRDNIGLVDLVAPGVAIASAYPGGRYAEMDGTSMAAPHVAGVAALAMHQQAGLTARESWQLLIQRAVPLGSPVLFGRGLVQVA